MIISFEGIEGAGKGVQTKKTAAYLQDLGLDPVIMREPGGTLYGEAIRKLLKNPEEAIPAIDQALAKHNDYTAQTTPTENQDFSRTMACELFLFLASRAEFMDKAVKPALAAGKTVLCDRLGDSSVAYQGGGHANGDPAIVKFIAAANRFALQGVKPDLTLFIDIPIATMLERLAQEHPDKLAFFERMYGKEFFERARDMYKQIARQEPERVKVINGIGTKEEVFERIKKHLDALIGKNQGA
ncbi:MAG: dTMP kinase [Patescibacteria group bacterium]|jgi:dTMP kinase